VRFNEICGNLVGNARWEINLGFAGSQNAQNSLTQELIPSGKHGATTENTKDISTLQPKRF
jgi:hypothetical protein